MNKLIPLIGALLLILTSCSNNEITDQTDPPKESTDPPKENIKLLLKTIQEVTSSPDASTLFSYDGFKITEASANRLYVGIYKIKYTYTGDFITKDEGYLNDELYVSNEYTYEDNKLKTAIFKGSNGLYAPLNETKLAYNYISENIVDIDIYSYSLALKVWYLSDPFPKVRLYFEDGNIVKREKFTADGEIYSTIIQEYDKNPNIYKNIIGFDKLFFTFSFQNVINRHLDIFDISNANNVIFSSESGRDKYNYNSAGYAIEKLHYYDQTNTTIQKQYTFY
jgi:hypothetical protein